MKVKAAEALTYCPRPRAIIGSSERFPRVVWQRPLLDGVAVTRPRDPSGSGPHAVPDVRGPGITGG